MKISFCYILRNAEKVIEESLNSIINNVPRELIHEICVALDTRTTDNTAIVLGEWGAKNKINVMVYNYTWHVDSFAEARNFNLSKATGDWIFVIDGDEKIVKWHKPPDDFDYLIGTTEQKLQGKVTSRLFYPRMFKRELDLKFSSMLHETLSIRQFVGKRGWRSDLIVENKEKTPEEVAKKAAWLLDLHFKQLKLEPDNQYVRGQIAYCYRAIGDFHNCLDFAFMSLTMDKDEMYNQSFNGVVSKIAPGKAQIANLIAECYYNLNKPDISKQYYALSLKFCNDQLAANAMLWQMAEDKEIKKVFHDNILRVGDNSKIQFDVLLENLLPLIEQS